MLGLNTSGRPDARDYLLGRAAVFVSALDSTTSLPDGYRPLGNAPNFSISVDIEELTHRASLTSDFGGSVIDRRIIITQTLNISMTLEELNHENVGLFFSGTTDNPVNPAVAGFAEYNITASLALNTWYPVQSSARLRCLGIDETKLTLNEDPDGTPTLLTLGAAPTGDYTVLETPGLIEFHSGGPATLAGGETIGLELAADPGAPATIERVLALKAAQTRYAVKVIVENASNADELFELEFHSVLLSGDGELGVVGDELAQMNLNGVAEANQQLTGTPTLTISKASDT